MLKTEVIINSVKLAIASGFVKNERPVSLILLAHPEAGKTLILSKFSKCDNVAYLTDVTAYGLVRDVIPRIQNNGLTHIIIPDLLKPLSRTKSTVQNLITFFNGLLEEGIGDMSLFWKQSNLVNLNEPLQCGLITALPEREIKDRRHQWNRIGFLSRLLPLSYSYSKNSLEEIKEYIRSEKHLRESHIQLKSCKRKKSVELPKHFAVKLSPYIEKYSCETGFYGFRYQRQLQTLLKASAILRGHNRVDEQDLESLLLSMCFFNYNFTEI